MQPLISDEGSLLIESTAAWKAAAVRFFFFAAGVHTTDSPNPIAGNLNVPAEPVWLRVIYRPQSAADLLNIHMCACLCVQVPAVGSRQHRAPLQSKWGHHQDPVPDCGWRQGTRWGKRHGLESERWITSQCWSQVETSLILQRCAYTLEVTVVQQSWTSVWVCLFHTANSKDRHLLSRVGPFMNPSHYNSL